jgi:hypothetical protein
MPYFSTQVVAAGNRARKTVTMPCDTGILVGASVVDITRLGQPCDTWVELGLMVAGNDQDNRAILLAQDYAGPGALVGWTGRLPLDAEMYIYANIYGSSGGTFNLVAVTETN